MAMNSGATGILPSGSPRGSWEHSRPPGWGEVAGSHSWWLWPTLCILTGLAGPLLGQVSGASEVGADPATEGLGQGQMLL